MPNAENPIVDLKTSQKDELDSYFGPDGIYSQTVVDDGNINTGTKVLYLERAINQDAATFARSIDKLYDPNTREPQNHQQLLDALQKINNFAQDNPLGNVSTLEFSLRHLEEGRRAPTNKQALKNYVKQCIEQVIISLKEANDEQVVENERNQRVDAENTIEPNPHWRTNIPSVPNERPSVSHNDWTAARRGMVAAPYAIVGGVGICLMINAVIPVEAFYGIEAAGIAISCAANWFIPNQPPGHSEHTNPSTTNGQPDTERSQQQGGNESDPAYNGAQNLPPGHSEQTNLSTTNSQQGTGNGGSSSDRAGSPQQGVYESDPANDGPQNSWARNMHGFHNHQVHPTAQAEHLPPDQEGTPSPPPV